MLHAEMARSEAEVEAHTREIWTLAGLVAREMMAPEPHAPPMFSRVLYVWRAANLGPKVAAQDFQRASQGGWWAPVWDRNGKAPPVEGLGPPPS